MRAVGRTAVAQITTVMLSHKTSQNIRPLPPRAGLIVRLCAAHRQHAIDAPVTMASVVSILPDGEPVPPDGALPPDVRAHGPFSMYVHVPYCASRCGYCDFNTYTASELGRRGEPGVVRALTQCARSRSRGECSVPLISPCRRSSSGAGRRHCCRLRILP